MTNTEKTLIEALIQGEREAIDYLTLIITKHARTICAAYNLQEEMDRLIAETRKDVLILSADKLRGLDHFIEYLYKITEHKATSVFIERLLKREKKAINTVTLIITKKARMICAAYNLQEEMDDLIAETAAAFWGKDDENLRSIDSLERFLHGITSNKAKDMVKSKTRMRIVPIDEITEQGEETIFESPKDQKLVKLAFEKLQEVDLRMYLLANFHHMSGLKLLNAMVILEGALPSKLSFKDKHKLPGLSIFEKAMLITEKKKCSMVTLLNYLFDINNVTVDHIQSLPKQLSVELNELIVQGVLKLLKSVGENRSIEKWDLGRLEKEKLSHICNAINSGNKLEVKKISADIRKRVEPFTEKYSSKLSTPQVTRNSPASQRRLSEWEWITDGIYNKLIAPLANKIFNKLQAVEDEQNDDSTLVDEMNELAILLTSKAKMIISNRIIFEKRLNEQLQMYAEEKNILEATIAEGSTSVTMTRSRLDRLISNAFSASKLKKMDDRLRSAKSTVFKKVRKMLLNDPRYKSLL